jgi:signal peptidase I
MKILVNNIVFLGFVGVFISLFFPGCAPVSPTTSQSAAITPDKESKVTLITGSYGYQVGDIVLLDTQKQPVPGDIVQYDWRKNKSDCMAMGPGTYLARIIGLPGDSVTFQTSSYQVNGLTADFSDSQTRGSQKILWGNQKYIFSELVGQELKVPENEFLADKWVGQECQGTDENGSSVAYGRYTIKREAIIGVIKEKLGHDKKFEEEQKGIVY